MRVTMMLADHAQVADGKLFISGGGWSSCGPGPIPCSVAVIFHVPWQHTNEKVQFSLRLNDEDGHPVTQPGPRGPQPVQVNGQFEAGRPPGMTPGTEIGVPMTFGSVLHLPPARRYTWVLEVSGQAEEDWRLSFATREAQAAVELINGRALPRGCARTWGCAASVSSRVLPRRRRAASAP